MNGHNKGRRYKLFQIEQTLLLRLMRGLKVEHEFIQLPSIYGLPEGSEIHGFEHSYAHGGLLLVVWNPEFPEIAPGEMLPVTYVPDLVTKTIVFRRTKLSLVSEAELIEALELFKQDHRAVAAMESEGGRG